MNKTCTKCRQTKPIEEFGLARSNKDGHFAWCKICARAYTRGYNANLAKEEKDHKRISHRQWHRENKDRVNALRREDSKLHRGKVTEAKKKYYKDHPEQRKAHTAVNHAVTRGKIPSARSFICSNCKERQADAYHHHKGYDKSHWLDVIPLCNICHRVIDTHHDS